MTDCRRAQDLIIAHVTSSLGDQEFRELLDHLAACEGCSAYLRDMARAMDGLPYTLPLIKPPPRLRERILARIARESQAGLPDEDPASADRAGREPGTPGEPVRRPPHKSPRWAWAVGAAAALLLGVQLHLVRQLAEDNGRLRAEVTQARYEIQAAATVLGEGVIRPEWVLRMEKGDGFERAWGHATLYRTRYGDVLVLAVGGLPPLDGKGAYRAWLWGEGEVTDAGPLRPDGAGFASLVVQLKHFDYRALSITWEAPGHQEAGPKGPRVLSVDAPAGAAPAGGPAPVGS